MRFAFSTDGVYADYTSCTGNKQQKNGARRKTEESNIFTQELQSAALRSKARCGILIKSDYKCGGKYYERYAGKGIAALH